MRSRKSRWRCVKMTFQMQLPSWCIKLCDQVSFLRGINLVTWCFFLNFFCANDKLIIHVFLVMTSIVLVFSIIRNSFDHLKNGEIVYWWVYWNILSPEIFCEYLAILSLEVFVKIKSFWHSSSFFWSNSFVAKYIFENI